MNINKRHDVTLYEEFRLIERSEVAINRAWKGAHLLLFFLAFVFGSFCTFCFHMLMYLFDEKCVLFPKLLSLTSLRHNVIYEFIPSSRDLSSLPVDFLSTQWVEKSTCALPTYVPLVSGIFGLVWTTMFLMCSTGSRTLTGLQRPWRVLPPVFLFSLAMGGLCVYSSAVTHYGLQELCVKLGEITGSSTCTYAVNVATLTYERRIRGVYQATRLTIVSAWLHTFCWLCSALLAAVRVILGVDFQLVRISVKLHGDVDKIMEQNEAQIQTIFPDNVWISHENETEVRSVIAKGDSSGSSVEMTELLKKSDNVLFDNTANTSELSLVPAESYRLAKISAYKNMPKEKQFIVKMVFDMIENLNLSDSALTVSSGSSTSEFSFEDDSKSVIGQQEMRELTRDIPLRTREQVDLSNTLHETEEVVRYTCEELLEKINKRINDKEGKDPRLAGRKLQIVSDAQVVELPMQSSYQSAAESVMNITDEMWQILKSTWDRNRRSHDDSSDKSDEQKKIKTKKSKVVQTGSSERKKPRKQQKPEEKPLSIPENTADEEVQSTQEEQDKVEKETQTRQKEKED